MKILITGAHGFCGHTPDERVRRSNRGSVHSGNERRTDQADRGGERSRCDHPHSCNFGCGDL